MFDRKLVAGVATKAIRAINNDPNGQVPYQFRDRNGQIVGEVEGVWQALENSDNVQQGTEAARYGNQRYVFKTDPDSPIQPHVGWRLNANGRVWSVGEEPDSEGLFLLWPLYETR